MIPESVTLTSLDDTSGSSKGNKQFPPLVEEVFDISKIVATESDGDHIFSMTVGEPEQPPLLRCADDDLVAHVPQQLKQKIWANKYITSPFSSKVTLNWQTCFQGAFYKLQMMGRLRQNPAN